MADRRAWMRRGIRARRLAERCGMVLQRRRIKDPRHAHEGWDLLICADPRGHFQPDHDQEHQVVMGGDEWGVTLDAVERALSSIEAALIAAGRLRPIADRYHAGPDGRRLTRRRGRAPKVIGSTYDLT